MLTSTPRAASPDPGTPASVPKPATALAPPTPASAPVALAGTSSDGCPARHAASPAAPRPPLPPRPPGAGLGATTTSSDVSGSDHHDQQQQHRASSASPPLRGAAANALLPKHTLVRVVGNARTRASLVGAEGRVRRSVGLGGWHLLTILETGEEVRLQRNALTVLAPPTGDETDSSDDEGDDGGASPAACVGPGGGAFTLPRTRPRRPPAHHRAPTALGVLGGGLGKQATPATSHGSAGGRSAATTAWVASVAVPTVSTSSPASSTSSAATEGWLARRLSPPALARYAAAHNLPAPTAAAAAAHWTGHALLDDRAVAGAFVAAVARARRY